MPTGFELLWAMGMSLALATRITTEVVTTNEENA